MELLLNLFKSKIPKNTGFGTQLTEFKHAIELLSTSASFVIFYHADCTDGQMASQIVENGLVASGFTVAEKIPYYHNTDNVSKRIDSIYNRYVMFVDVTPSPKEYNVVDGNARSVLIMDHHPLKPAEGYSVDDLKKKFVYDETIFLIYDGCCATLLATFLFDSTLMNNKYISHVNKFDIHDLSDPVTNYVAAYNRVHMADNDFAKTMITNCKDEKFFIDVVALGKKYFDEASASIKSSLAAGKFKSVNINEKKVNIFETEIVDPLFTNDLSNAYYNMCGETDSVVVTLFYPKSGGTKLSFRSHKDGNVVCARHVASRVGGGGHDHVSAYFTPKIVTSYTELI